VQILNLPIREQPDKRFIVQITDLNSVPPWISKIAAKAGLHLEPVFFDQLVSDLANLSVVPHHQTEVLHPIRLQCVDFKDGKELMLADLAPGRTFSAPKHFEAKHIGVERDRFFGIVYLNDDMVDPIHLYIHDSLSPV